MNDSVVIFLVLGIAGWLWWDSRGVAEKAFRHAQMRCEWARVTLLNDTVAWRKVRLGRNVHGRVTLKRTYSFEFTSDSSQRYQGEIVMLGHRLKSITMEPHRFDQWSP